MQGEIIAVGTELLLGQIVNTNAAVVARALAAIGIDVMHQQVVGDNARRLTEAIELAASRADLVVLIGGLGPTADDLTKQVVAKHVGVTLAMDEAAEQKLEAYATQQGQNLTANNWVQAQLPKGAKPLANRIGLAVGALVSDSGTQYALLPGPPKEFEPMVHEVLMPELLRQMGQGAVLQSRVLRFFGIGESQLVTELADLIEAQTNPTLATYIGPGDVTLRITAKAQSQKAADDLIDPVVQAVLARVGTYYYGAGEATNLAAVTVAALAARRLRVTAVESLTAGAFQAALGAIPGVSEWFQGGFVTYSEQTKTDFVGVAPAIIAASGVVSEETAQAMAQGALARTGADIAISFTGVAGPGEHDGQPAGTVWIGLAQKQGPTIAKRFSLPGARNDVRAKAVQTGLFWLLRTVQAMG